MIRSSRMAFAGTLAMAGVTFLAAPARAQGSQTSAVAEALYQDGVKLMKEGKTHDACLKFGESQRADPSTGTLINLAVCHEKEGKTASAWSEFTDASSQAGRAGQKDRESFARDHATALEKQLHRVVIDIAGADKTTDVKLDGETLGSGALGTAIPLDPGEHELRVSAPGKKASTQTVRIATGAGTEHIAVAALEIDPAAGAATNGAPSTSTAPATTSPPDGADTITPGSPTKKYVGFGLIGVGVVGLGFGTYYLVRSIQLEKDSTAKDGSGQFLNANHTSLHSDAQLARTLSIVAGATGIVAAGVGVYFVLTSGPTVTHKTARGIRLVPSGDASSARLDLLGAW